jgi:outer membrane lipoprotein-sorting protein
MNSRTTKIAIAAAVIIAVLIGFHYLGGSVDGTSVAWADVLNNVEAARTVTYRDEFESGDTKEIATVRIIEPYLRRSDILQGSGNYNVVVTDTQKNKCMNFYPRTKTVVIGKDTGHPSGYQFRSYETLKKDLRDGTERDLGRVKLNGRDTLCFEITRENRKTTVWADPNTALPIQIETLSDENGRTRTLMSDIRFDIELDMRLFEPPADYCLLDLQTQRWTTPFPLTEKHLLEGLAVGPKYLEGRFRTRYAGGRPLTDEVRKKITEEAQKLNWSEEEAHRSSLGCAFIEQLPEGSDYQYVGEDVRLGDATKTVCWWKPAGSKTYRVVYGDLSVRDVEPQDLPPIPWLAQQK